MFVMLVAARALPLCPLSLQVCGHRNIEKDGLKKKNDEKREREKKTAT